MILIPDALICARVQAHQTHLDRKSTEESTGKQKRKYKVAGHHVAATCVFYVLTSKEDRCKAITTLSIAEHEWDQRDPASLHGTSFMDVTKTDVLSYGEVAQKIQDPENQFAMVAKLPASKVREFKHRLGVARGLKEPRIPKRVTAIIQGQVAQEPGMDQILKDLGLA